MRIMTKVDWKYLGLLLMPLSLMVIALCLALTPIAIGIDCCFATETKSVITLPIDNFIQDEDEYCILTDDGKVHILNKLQNELFAVPDDSRIETTTFHLQGFFVDFTRVERKIYVQREILFPFR